MKLNQASKDYLSGLFPELTKVSEEIKRPEKPVAAKEPAQENFIDFRSVFSNTKAHPYVIDRVMLKLFGLEWFTWIHETVFSEIERTTKTSISDVNKHKIMAVKTLHVTDVFWDHWEVFEKIICVFNNAPSRWDLMTPPTIAMLYAGIEMAEDIRKEDFTEEIAKYIAAAFMLGEVTYAAPPLAFCQPYLSAPMYECLDCAKVGSALPPFAGYCDSCSHRFSHEKAFTMQPADELKGKSVGKNIKIKLTVDPMAVRQRFDYLNSLPPEKLQSELKTGDDLEAARLIYAVDYAKYFSELKEFQLNKLKGWL